jgi:glutaminyl-peptide cyclotransferase
MLKHKLQANKSMLGTCILLLPLATPCSLCAQQPSAETFNGGRAFADLKTLVGFGPRPAGSPALAEARRWIGAQLKEAGANAGEDSFTASTPIGALPMTDIIAKFPGSESKIVIVAGHYDTKRYDNFRFVGANDGASSAALLLELARELHSRKHNLTYWLVFFDGEEAVREQWTDTDSVYGSRHLVQELSSNGELGRVRAMILVDMIGDANLDIHREAQSTPWLTNLVFNAAHRLGYTKEFLDSPNAASDDHIPFIDAGVAAADLIDFDYGPNNGYWHTDKDLPEHCSPQSLAIVGRVVLASLADLDRSPQVK